MRRLARRLVRGLAYVLAGVSLLVLVLAGLLWLWLPKLPEYKPEVEHLLSSYLGQTIVLTTLGAEWDGFDVTLRASGVRVAVEDHPGSGMRFGEILVSFSPLGLFRGDRTLERLELRGPTIEASRLPDGRIRVGDTILGTPRGTVRRLLQGRNVEVTDGTLIWRDALAPEQDLHIENMHLRILPSGFRRQFEFTANAPEELVHGFMGYGIYDPDSLSAGSWSASANVIVKHLDLSRIPAVIQERLPWKSRGYVDTDFHVKWSRGVLTSASADLSARDFFIPYAKDKTPLAAKRFSSTVSWKRSKKEWRLVFTNPEIAFDDTAVSVSRFEVERRAGRRIYSGQAVNVQDLLGVVNRLDIDLPWKDLIDSLHPRGVFSQAALTLTGPYLEATGWRFDGEFRGVGWRAQEKYPGVQGVDGHLGADDTGGALSVSSRELRVDAAHSLRQPVSFSRAEAKVKWYKWGGDWVVDVGDGVIVNDDLALADLNVYARVSEEGSKSPYVLTRFRIQRADVAALRGYLPAKRMTGKQVEWLDRALAGGEIRSGRFYLNGRLDQFPYRDGNGELRINARVGDGVLDFNEKWPALKMLDGVVDINNARFEANASHGAIMNSTVNKARVWSDDFFRRDRVVHIQGELTAPANDVVQFLRRGPLNKNPPPEYSRMSGQGEGTLALEIELPFTRLKDDTRVQGDYTVENASVEVADGVEFTKVSGTVRFTESTVQGQGLKAELFGGPVRADVSTEKPGRPMTFAISGSGEADASRLEPVVGPVLVSRLGGRARWSGRFVGGPGPNRLEVKSDLKGVEVSFPAPLWKPGDIPTNLAVGVTFDEDRRRIEIGLEDRLRGELRYAREDRALVLTRGVLNLGGERKLPDSELVIGVKGESIDVDRWLDEIEDMNRLKEQAGRANPERDALFDHLRALDVDVERFRYLRRNLAAVKVAATSADGRDWTARFSGPRMQGTGRLLLDREPSQYDFEMTHLYWPQLQNTESAATYKPPPDPTRFARLSIRVGDFRYGDMRLGRLDFLAEPDAEAWRIRRLSLTQPEFEAHATGRWMADHTGAQTSRVDVSATASDLGRTLELLGLKDQVAKGRAELSADLSWSGQPGDFRLAVLDGDLTFKAEDGRFLKVEPGSGRLLGLFNVDTLTRRLKLDFADVFKEGLTFDRIDGKAGIEGGVLRTEGIYIIGPTALLELGGSTDLGKETYDLEVTVAPQLGGNFALAGAIANPVAGAMIFVVQKLFRKQMAKLIQYKYRVTGAWDDPLVEPVERPAPDAADHIGRN